MCVGKVTACSFHRSCKGSRQRLGRAACELTINHGCQSLQSSTIGFSLQPWKVPLGIDTKTRLEYVTIVVWIVTVRCYIQTSKWSVVWVVGDGMLLMLAVRKCFFWICEACIFKKIMVLIWPPQTGWIPGHTIHQHDWPANSLPRWHAVTLSLMFQFAHLTLLCCSSFCFKERVNSFLSLLHPHFIVMTTYVPGN